MRHLRPSLLLTAGVLVVSACGGSPGPTMDAAVAEDLAARADALAAGLDAGDACAALETAGELVRVTAERRDAGEVPEEIAGEVIGTTRDTVRGLTCEPEPEPPPPDDDDTDDEDEDDDARGGEGKDDDGKGKGEGEGKGESEGKGKDKDADGERDD